MKAVIIEKFGPPEVLQICDREKPQVKKDELLVKVKAISLNPLDYKVRNGSMGPLFRLMLPKIVGSDFAGVIEEAGTETAEYKAGERVFGSLSPFKSGACAEYIAVKADQVAPIPDEISYEEAAALPIAGLTALQSLRNLGKVGQNSMVLINGAAGGVGHFALQLATIFGAQVTAVCGTANVQLAKQLGADEVADYSKENIFDRKQKYDLFFDVVGNASLKEALNLLSGNGVYVTTLPTLQKVLKSFLSPGRVKIAMVKKQADDLAYLARLTADRKLKVVISKTYSLEEIQKAHSDIETGHTRGKLVINI